MRLVKTVFHVHSDYSFDCDYPLEALIQDARARGVQCVTPTDHDTMEGVRAAQELAGRDLQIIAGQEITTREGHLIGLFLHEEIEPGLSARRTAELIRRQGGLVVVPHPFNRLFNCSLRESVYELIDLVDIVEVSNAQNFLSSPNRQARALAERYQLPMLTGVDAHHPGYLDSSYQWIPVFKGPREFLAAVRQAQRVEGRHPASYFFKTALYEFASKCGLGAPERYGRNCPYMEREPAAEKA